MKTSNKLLIIFLLLMFAVPLCIVAYVTSSSHSRLDDFRAMEKTLLHFNTPTPYQTSITLNKPFRKLDIADGKEKTWTINYIKDQQTGIKIPERLKDILVLNTDVNGILKLELKAGTPGKTERLLKINGLELYIYAPVPPAVSVNNAGVLSIRATADTLDLSLRNLSHVYLAENFVVQRLKLNLENIPTVMLTIPQMKSLDVQMKAASLAVENTSCEFMKISASDHSSINFREFSRCVRRNTVKSLALFSDGENYISLDNVSVYSISAKLSDETNISMPVRYMKQLLK